jgi:hypothetical protein
MFSPMYDKRRHQGHGDNGVSFAGSRGPLEFEAGTDTPFDCWRAGKRRWQMRNDRRTRAAKGRRKTRRKASRQRVVLMPRQEK